MYFSMTTRGSFDQVFSPVRITPLVTQSHSYFTATRSAD
jgi:hypothetical protein